MREATVAQIRVHKQPRPRRRAQEEPEARAQLANRRRAPSRRTGAKIYDGLGLPSWRE
jgi:hypothetical protein